MITVADLVAGAILATTGERSLQGIVGIAPYFDESRVLWLRGQVKIENPFSQRERNL
jgi:hypothetical protein